MNEEIIKLFDISTRNQDEMNGVGKKSLICEIVEFIPDNHLDWLLNILRERYYKENTLSETGENKSKEVKS